MCFVIKLCLNMYNDGTGKTFPVWPFRLYVVCVTWTAYLDRKFRKTNSSTVVRLSTSNTVVTCQLACRSTADCVAVGFSDANPIKWRCFLVLGDRQLNATTTTVAAAGFMHYQLDRTCNGLRL